MRTIRARRFVAATLLLSVVAVTATAQRFLADVSGKWAISVTSPDGTASESSAALKQDGESLTGTIESALFGSANAAGTVKGDTVRFAFTINMQGTPYELRAGGLLKDKDNIAGSLDLPNGMGSMPFTMKRQP